MVRDLRKAKIAVLALILETSVQDRTLLSFTKTGVQPVTTTEAIHGMCG